MITHSTRRTRVVLPALLLGWATAVTSGFAILLRYKTTPGEATQPLQRWPSHSRLTPSSDLATLVLFAHPHCPCTHASVSELARLMSRVSGRVVAYVVVVRPPGVPEDWDDTELRRRAAAIPGIRVIRDGEGLEAARFGAAVSGLTLLYDEKGQLRFAGGITASRGHEGESFGGRRILAVLAGETPDRQDAPVFGCALGASANVGVEEGS